MLSRAHPRRLAVTLTAITLLAAIAAPSVGADDISLTKGFRKGVTLAGVREHQAALQAIADENGDTRASGLPGYEASAHYVFDRLTDAGYDPILQPFDFPFFRQLATSVFERTAPNPPVAYTEGGSADFSIMTYSPTGNATAPVTHVIDQPGGAAGPGCDAADFLGFPAGNIALIQRGLCTFNIKANNAEGAGASAVVIYNNVAGALNGTLGTPDVGVPVIGTTLAIGQANVALLGSGLTFHVATTSETGIRETWNVIADTPSGDPNSVVVVGAHLDSRVEGPGINDNGSGSATILEIAEVFAAQDREARNKLRFMWYGAEELNLLGSTHYINDLSDEDHAKIMAMLNFDMVGSPNYVRFVYDGDNSAFPVGPGVAAGPPGSAFIEDVFLGYFASQGLAADPTPFSGRSDYGPFIATGIPAGGLFTGAEGLKTAAQVVVYGGTVGTQYDPCYHILCDDFDNNSDIALDQMADAAAHAVLTMSRVKVDITQDAAAAKVKSSGSLQKKDFHQEVKASR